MGAFPFTKSMANTDIVALTRYHTLKFLIKGEQDIQKIKIKRLFAVKTGTNVGTTAFTRNAFSR